MASVLSVNVGAPRPLAVPLGRSGIDKRPVDGAVRVTPPGWGESGLAGDTIWEKPHHGGPDQAVYAYAREDLDGWEAELGRTLPPGTFGENLTTAGLDVTGAVLGERWRIGEDLVLQVTTPRIPCRTFATWLGERGWVRTFTLRARPGAYLRVLEPGEVRAGDPVEVTDRPDSPVTIGVAFRAITTEPELLPLLLDAPCVLDELRDTARRRAPYDLLATPDG
jgi:MOSC domain-containing protein YiiM